MILMARFRLVKVTPVMPPFHSFLNVIRILCSPTRSSRFAAMTGRQM